MKQRARPLLPLIMVFVITNGFFAGAGTMLRKWGADQDVLLIGNLLLFVITLLSFFLGQRGLRNPNPHAFVRSVYGSIMIKMFLCLIMAFVYISIQKAALNKPALFTSMGLYLVYTALEVSALMKSLKRSTNA